MIFSVEPLTSAAWTTSKVHSGCANHLAVRVFLPERVNLRHGEPRVDGTMALPQQQLRVPRLLRGQAAADLVRIPHRHAVERHAQLVGGVAAEMLVGQHHELLALVQAHVITAAAFVEVQTTPPCCRRTP
jgi:hypothetical protein